MEGGNFEEEEWQGVMLLILRGIWNLGKEEEEEAAEERRQCFGDTVEEKAMFG